MPVTNEHFVDEALRLVTEAEAHGLRLRILGSLAFRLHCTENVGLLDQMQRELTDVDFAAEGKQARPISEFLQGEGYLLDDRITVATEGKRYFFEHPHTGLGVDVFVDELYFCHPIPFEGRLDLDAPTIPTADLLLEKMQIVEINLKDIKDTMVLLLEHPLGADKNSRESIDASYITQILSRDWGFYHTVTTNLAKVRELVGEFESIGPAEAEVIRERIGKLLEQLEAAPKSRKWKLRAKMGTKKRWYQEVSEKEPGF